MRRSFELWMVVLVGVLATFGAFLAGPFVPAPLVAIGFVSLIKNWLNKGKIYPPQLKDYIIIGIITLILFITYIGIVTYIYTITPFWKILIVAVISDIGSYWLGKLEDIVSRLGDEADMIFDFVAAIIIFFIASFIIGGGVSGLIIGGIASFGSMYKNKIPVTTLVIMSLYFITNYITSMIEDLKFLLGGLF